MPVPPKDRDLFEAIGAMQEEDLLPWRIPLHTAREVHRFRHMVKRYGRANGHELEIVVSPTADKAYIIAIGEAVEPTYGRGRRGK